MDKIKIMIEYEYEFIHGDCLNVLKTMSDKSVSIFVTSPPYNIGIKYGDYKDKKPKEVYLEWLYDIFSEIKRVLKDDGHVFLNVGYTNKDPWISMEIAIKLRPLFYLQNNITWVKNISIKDESYGHFKPINSKRYINPTNESIFHFTKNGNINLDRLAVGVPYKWKCNLKERSKKKNKTNIIKKDKRCKGNTWYIPYKTIKNKREKGYHPATFPEELVKQCILLTGLKTGIVLDPFVGSGTTVLAVKNINDEYEEYQLDGIGIDIEESYIHYCRELV